MRAAETLTLWLGSHEAGIGYDVTYLFACRAILIPATLQSIKYRGK